MTPRARQIIEDVALEHSVPYSALIGPCRARATVLARWAAMARIRAVESCHGRPRYSLPQIGRIFGRDHTTVCHGLRRADELFGVSQPFGAPEVQDHEETRL